MSARLSKAATSSLLLFGALSLAALTSLSSAKPSSSNAGPTADSKYIGAAKCKNCHGAVESGDQYGAWSQAKHAHAFEVLGGEEAKKLAAAVGIEDATKADACLKCHVTGHGQPEDAFARGWKQDLGVQCETCHAPSSEHMKARFKAAAGGKAEGYQGVPADEVLAVPGVDLCVGCHNPESPSYEPFCYFEARGKVAHLNPKKPRTEEEVASFGKCPHGTPCPHAEGCPEGTCNLKPEKLAELKKAHATK